MQEKTRRVRPWRLPIDPRNRGARERTLERVFERALRLTAAMPDAERHIILAIAFAHVLEMTLPQFTTALRKYKRGRYGAAIAR